MTPVELQAAQAQQQRLAKLRRRARWISLFVQAAAAKEVAKSITDPAVRASVEQNAESAIAQAIDDYCGTGTGRAVNPSPWPGPPPAIFSLITQLAVLSNTLQPGAMRTELSAIAGRLMEKAVRMQKGV